MEEMNLVENVEQVVENVVDNMEPETIKTVGVTACEVVGLAAVTYAVFEGVKYGVKKIKDKRNKRKIEKAWENFDINKPVEPIDVEESDE